MKLAVNMVMGSMLNALSEGLALSERVGLSQEALLEVLDAGAMSCGLFRVKGKQILAGEHPPSFPLKHHQKDMRLALAVGDEVGQPMPVAAAANEVGSQGLGFWVFRGSCMFERGSGCCDERTGFKVLLSSFTISERNKSCLGERGADC
jgi:hypothetical protein